VALVKIYRKDASITDYLHGIPESIINGFLAYPKYKDKDKQFIITLCTSISNELNELMKAHNTLDNELLIALDKTNITSIDDKEVHAEVSSPIKLLNTMINNICNETLINNRPTFLDYSCGKGNIVLVIFMKYYEALQTTDLSDTDICKLLCESYLFIADINPLNVYITQCKLLFLCKLITGKDIKYSFNSYIGDSFKLDLSAIWNIDNVDYVFVNPPFEDKVNRNSTQHKLWIDFTLKTFEDWLSPNGYLYQISPSSFVSPSSKVFKLFKQKQVDVLHLQQEAYFPTVNSSIAWYIIKNVDNTVTETLINGTTKLLFDKDLLYLPNDFNLISFSIHKKVMFDTKDKLDVKYDYVTCHNNIILKATRNKTHSTLSKVKTDTHIHQVFHTNKQVWWSEIKQGIADKKKVIWTRSGYAKAFYDDGKFGITDLSYYVLVDSEEAGKYLENILTSKLFTYIFKTAKWSGFGNDKVFYSLPKIPHKKYTDIELFTHFELTEEEITYLS